jgi:hypothetical protein
VGMGLLFQIPVGIVAIIRVGNHLHEPVHAQPPLRDRRLGPAREPNAGRCVDARGRYLAVGPPVLPFDRGPCGSDRPCAMGTGCEQQPAIDGPTLCNTSRSIAKFGPTGLIGPRWSRYTESEKYGICRRFDGGDGI